MWAALAPIETRTAEGSALSTGDGEIDAEAGQQLGARARHLTAILAENDAAIGDERVGEADAQPAGEMVVAGACAA
jgi:hypothetical protein